MKVIERVNEIDRRIERLLASQERTEKEIRELRASQKQTDEQLRKTDEEIRELRASQKQTDEQLRKTHEEITRIAKKLDNVGKYVGDLTDGWGKFVLGLSEPSILSSLKELGFNLLEAYSPSIRTRDGREYEIDILCPAIENGKIKVIVIETKSSFTQKKVKDFIAKLKEFKNFYPEYISSKVFAGIAGVRLTKEVKLLSEEYGLYLFSVKEGMMKNINSAGFKPMVW